MMKKWIFAVGLVAVMLLPSPASAACPTFEAEVVGNNSANTLRGRKAGEPTRFRGRGGRDTFVVERPAFYNPFGCDQRDHWDEVLDFQANEIVEVPGTPSGVRFTRSGSQCRIWWDPNYFVIFKNCPSTLTRSRVVIR